MVIDNLEQAITSLNMFISFYQLLNYFLDAKIANSIFIGKEELNLFVYVAEN